MEIVTAIVNLVVAHQWTALLWIPGLLGALFWKTTNAPQTITGKLCIYTVEVITIASVAAVSFVRPEIGTLSVLVSGGTVEQITDADFEINFRIESFEQRHSVLVVTDKSGRELDGLVPVRSGPGAIQLFPRANIRGFTFYAARAGAGVLVFKWTGVAIFLFLTWLVTIGPRENKKPGASEASSELRESAETLADTATDVVEHLKI